jgi:pyridoxine 4-dehydrogenase
MRLTANADGSPSDRDRAISVLRHAIDMGVNHIDTAAFYFSPLRSANELISRALAPYPDDLVIATKVGPGRDLSGDWLPLARPDQLRGQVEEDLRQLGRDHLDLVYLRQHGLESIAEHFGALAELRDAGLIRHLGISNVRPHHLPKLGPSRRWSACRTRTASTTDVYKTGSSAAAASTAWHSCRSSRSPVPDARAGPAAPITTSYSP